MAEPPVGGPSSALSGLYRVPVEERRRTVAELTGLDGELGTIEPGKRADLVVVDGDPFEFRDLGERVEAVYQDGRLVAQRAVPAGDIVAAD